MRRQSWLFADDMIIFRFAVVGGCSPFGPTLMEQDPPGSRSFVPKHHAPRPPTGSCELIWCWTASRPRRCPLVARKTKALTFNDFNLHPALLQALDAAGFTEPTPIQAAALPIVLAGRDVIGSAQTGTGKTAAFVLPALQRLANVMQPRPRGPRILVLAPTRELATQILDTTRQLAKFMRLHTVSVLGGMPYRVQLRELSRPIDLMVATPGRLIDLLDRRAINLADLEMLVLDEADRMLDMGFIDAVETIASAAPASRQTVMFTATFDRRMNALAGRLLKDPERVEIESETVTLDAIEQRLHLADNMTHKRKLLGHFAASSELGKAIIFAATKRDADALAEELKAQGHKAAALHGDMAQNARNWTVRQLRDGRIRLLVATDVAARGIDVPDITHVINFDLPRQAEDYVHRIGRTGRAGATGIAISFAAPADRQLVERIERFTRAKLTTMVIPGLEPTANFSGPFHARKPAPRRGGWSGGYGGGASAGGPARRPAPANNGGVGPLRRAG
jgi:superfamily II DNA/RNA helicase